MSETIRVLALGAHPDDCDIKAGGCAILWARMGHHVRFVSVTNGDAGHHEQGGGALAKRRAEEARRAGQIAGIEYTTLDNHDGELTPSLETRKQLIRLIRRENPHLILTHRPNDYHPDHRYTGILTQDSAYMVTVPNICPDAPHMSRNPAIMYMSDGFQKPIPFQATVAAAVDEAQEAKLDMLHQHESQFYEWLPYNGGYLSETPAGDAERRAWLAERRGRPNAERWRGLLEQLYGEDRGRAVQHAEAFELSEYGRRPSLEELLKLFPFIR